MGIMLLWGGKGSCSAVKMRLVVARLVVVHPLIGLQPIRTPGAVQGFGVLIAVAEVEDALVVRQISEVGTSWNSA